MRGCNAGWIAEFGLAVRRGVKGADRKSQLDTLCMTMAFTVIGYLLSCAFIYSKSKSTLCYGRENVLLPTYLTYKSNLKNLSNFDLDYTKKRFDHELSS